MAAPRHGRRRGDLITRVWIFCERVTQAPKFPRSGGAGRGVIACAGSALALALGPTLHYD